MSGEQAAAVEQPRVIGGAHSGGIGLILLAAIAYSMGTTLIKLGMVTGTSAVTLLTLRFLLSTAILWGIAFAFQPERIKIDRRGLFWGAAAGAMNSVSIFCMYQALTKVDVSIMQVIYALHPLVVLLLLSLRGERIYLLSLIRLVLAVAGVYLLMGPAGEITATSLLLLTVFLIAYSLYLVLIQWYMHGYHPYTTALYIVSFMTIFVTVTGVLIQPAADWLGPINWLAVIGPAIFSTVIARTALFAGIKRIGSGQTSLLSPVETVLTVLWATLFLGERLALVQLLGGGFILFSAASGVWRRPVKKREVS